LAELFNNEKVLVDIVNKCLNEHDCDGLTD
jgi:hypothetical protein